MDVIFWIAALSVAGSLTVLAVVFWAATDFLVALARYVQVYRNAGPVRDDLVKFAREIAKARCARCERATLKALAQAQPTKEGGNAG